MLDLTVSQNLPCRGEAFSGSNLTSRTKPQRNASPAAPTKPNAESGKPIANYEKSHERIKSSEPRSATLTHYALAATKYSAAPATNTPRPCETALLFFLINFFVQIRQFHQSLSANPRNTAE